MDNQLERQAFEQGWLVGIVDGEGCFTLNVKTAHGGKQYYPTVQITNTNIAIMEKAQRIIKDMGLACYFYARMPKTGKPYYRIEIAGLKRVKRFMDLLGDKFECRHMQASLLRQYVELRLSKTSHAPYADDEHRIAAALREANTKGFVSSEAICSAPNVVG